MKWETVIGLEVHAQLATNSKIFSGASTTYGANPNTQACYIDLAMPGVLPVLNQEAVRMAVMFGVSINADIAKRSVFARKNYFYPDLPKGYQISQYDLPIVGKGHLDITLEDDSIKRIGITRAHLEEDAGKSIHGDIPNTSCIDLNRAGTPLLEIVSEPDLRSPKEAVLYLKALRNLIRYLGISNANMQEGSFRCDTNVSVRPMGQKELGTRAEVKNVNSFRFIERAIKYEVKRQIEILENGGTIRQETRLYDSVKNETRSMRGKEEAMDYRYFPEPDLLPLLVDDDYIEAVSKQLPELPHQKRERFHTQYQLSQYDANNLTSNQDLANYFESVVANTQTSPKLAANWIMGELAASLNKNALDILHAPISSNQLANLLNRIEDGTISGKIAKEVFEAIWENGGDADAIIERRGLKQITNQDLLTKIIDEVLAANGSQLEQYRAGKEALFGFFVGQVMKQTKGQANPKQVNQLLKEKLSNPS